MALVSGFGQAAQLIEQQEQNIEMYKGFIARPTKGEQISVVPKDSPFFCLRIRGIRTTADATNRLAVKSDGVLLSHDDVTPGTGHMRVTLNKSAAAKDTGFTFQDAFSTHALFGAPR